MHSKSRVRLSAPLEPFTAGLDAELARLGYTPAGTDPGPVTAAGQLLERFGVFLAAERGLAGKTRGAHLDSARRFLVACGRAGDGGLPVSTLTASEVTVFLAGMARIQAPGTTQNTASMLRTFLTWLYAEGLITAPLARAVPGATAGGGSGCLRC